MHPETLTQRIAIMGESADSDRPPVSSHLPDIVETPITNSNPYYDFNDILEPAIKKYAAAFGGGGPGEPTDTEKSARHLHFILTTKRQLSTDWDHTIVDSKPIFDDDIKITAREGYLPIELENIDLLCLLALTGTAVNIETGKGANAWRWAMYIQERLDLIATKLGNKRHDKLGSPFHNRLLTLHDNQPVVFTYTSSNGARSIDLLSNQIIIDKPIPLTAWERLQKHGDLLRDSTLPQQLERIQKRRNHFGSVTLDSPVMTPRVKYDETKDHYALDRVKGIQVPVTNQVSPDNYEPIIRYQDLTREVDQQLSEPELNHRMQLQADIRDFAVFIAGESTKANLVLDIQKIKNDPTLNSRWEQTTGIHITDNATLYHAVQALFRDTGVKIFQAHAQGITYFDIGAIDKQNSSRKVKNYTQGLLRCWMREIHGIEDESVAPEIPKFFTTSLGDAPPTTENEFTNDAPMISHTGGVNVGPFDDTQIKKRNGWPMNLNALCPQAKNIQLTHWYLMQLLVGSVQEQYLSKTVDAFIAILASLRQERRTALKETSVIGKTSSVQ
ncbi:hypothetical protein HY948_00255 [Candidatus Gottesmanbacteria bacterium]|nr:hypothetical protein [Candidatus Gottesmanbacteria bacterium]